MKRHHEVWLVRARLTEEVVLQREGDSFGEGAFRVAGITAGEIVAVSFGATITVPPINGWSSSTPAFATPTTQVLFW